ncbi:hypothetical protein ACLK1S_16765 [Escherichia coli]
MLRGNTVSDAPLIIGSLEPPLLLHPPHDRGRCAEEESKWCRTKNSSVTALSVKTRR